MKEIKVVSGKKSRFLLRFLVRFLFPYREEWLPETLAETYFINRNQLCFCFYLMFLVSIRKKFLDWEGLKGRGLTGDLDGRN